VEKIEGLSFAINKSLVVMQPPNKPFHRTRYSSSARFRRPVNGSVERPLSADLNFSFGSIAQPNDRVHDRAAQSLFGHEQPFVRS
jgi:hypothetical protein